jgi:hypothetical protein
MPLGMVYKSYRIRLLSVKNLLSFSNADPHQRDADPEPTFHSDADLDPTFQFDADPDLTTHFFSDLDPPTLQNDPRRVPPFFTLKRIRILHFTLMRIRILPFSLMRIRIWTLLSTFSRSGPSNDPKWPSKASTFSLWCGSGSYFSILMRIQIQPTSSMRIQIQLPKMIRIHADQDPQHWVGYT